MEKKKVFVEVSLIILVAVLSFVGMRMQSTQVDLTDRFILDGGIGIFGFFFRSVLVPKKFDFLDWLFIVACGFFRFLAFDLRCGVWIFLFGFRFLFDSSGHHALPLISKSRETCVGSFRVLRTGM